MNAQRLRLCLADCRDGPLRRTLVIDLDVICKGMPVIGFNGQFAHRIRPRPHFRAFLETASRLFRLAVWSKNGGPWTDAALLALDPEQELLARRMLNTGYHDVDSILRVLDTGEVLHPDDILIVSCNRHAFGMMAQNVIEVEPCAVTYGAQYDDVLLQLAALLLRHLATDGPAGGHSNGGASAPPQLPPAVPEELRRMGLDSVRISAQTNQGVLSSIRVDERQMFSADEADPLGFSQRHECSDVTHDRASLQHLEYLDLVRPGADGSCGRDEPATCSETGTAWPGQLQQQLVLGDSLEWEDGAYAGGLPVRPCTAPGYRSGSSDGFGVADGIVRARSTSGSLGSRSSTLSPEVLSGYRNSNQRRPPQAGLDSPYGHTRHTIFAKFVHKVRCVVSTAQPKGAAAPYELPPLLAVSTGRPATTPDKLTRLRDFVSRSFRRWRVTSGNCDSQNDASVPAASIGSSSSVGGRSSSNSNSNSTRPNSINLPSFGDAVDALRQYVGEDGGAIGSCTASVAADSAQLGRLPPVLTHPWGMEMQRTSPNRIALMCASLGVRQPSLAGASASSSVCNPDRGEDEPSRAGASWAGQEDNLACLGDMEGLGKREVHHPPTVRGLTVAALTDWVHPELAEAGGSSPSNSADQSFPGKMPHADIIGFDLEELGEGPKSVHGGSYEGLIEKDEVAGPSPAADLMFSSPAIACFNLQVSDLPCNGDYALRGMSWAAAYD
ncbi:hypothetical protein Vafri_6439 [Volvox africanus]|nr:hypothetical protein Vafri_6439 [Volvox africanus]